MSERREQPGYGVPEGRPAFGLRVELGFAVLALVPIGDELLPGHGRLDVFLVFGSEHIVLLSSRRATSKLRQHRHCRRRPCRVFVDNMKNEHQSVVAQHFELPSFIPFSVRYLVLISIYVRLPYS
jgi:hypothetical protein